MLLSPQTEPSNIGVDDIARMVSGIVAAQQMPTNDSDLVKRLKETLSAAQTIKDAEAAARAEARTKYAAGERLMAKSDKESETIDDAIATYKTALDQNTHDHAQKTKISEALEVAVQAKVAQDEARAAAQAKYKEGSELFREEKWDEAIAIFGAGSQEKVNDESITRNL